MKAEELSITDLKAAHDFIKEFIKEMEEKLIKKGVDYEKQKPYQEYKELENTIYHALLNKVTSIE